MKSPTFEIKIAFCGYVNSGKSTLVNALLQEKYAEVSMIRSTYSVNSFRIFSKNAETPSITEKCSEESDDYETLSSAITETEKTATQGAVASWSILPENLHSASETHHAISNNNEAFGGTSKIKESNFDIEVKEPLCEMREDSQLVVVDLPGFTDVTDESTINFNFEYVRNNWDNFDCVVVVLDVMENINHQTALLLFVSDNLEEKKDIPVIFVCNKVDNPDNQEIAAKSIELESAVNKMFAKNVFISMCAQDAMIYRTASGVSFEQFQRLDKTWIEKIGTDAVSRAKWRQLSEKERYAAGFAALRDETLKQESLAATNFPNFLVALNEAVGGSTVQFNLIRKQLSVALQSVQTFDTSTVATMSKIKSISDRLGMATDVAFTDHFWRTYKNYVNDAIGDYMLTANHKVFHLAMSQLVAFDAELHRMGLPDYETEHRKVVDAMIRLVRLQLTELLKYAESWQQRYMSRKAEIDNFVYMKTRWLRVLDDQPPPPSHPNDSHHWERLDADTWRNTHTQKVVQSKCNPVTKKSDWFELSMRDFEIAFSSLLLLSFSKYFCLYFGPEKIRMDSFLRKFDFLRESFEKNPMESPFRCMFQSLAGKYFDSGKFSPANAKKYNIFVHLNMPDEISDPEHWGHLAWMFCEFMEQTSNQR